MKIISSKQQRWEALVKRQQSINNQKFIDAIECVADLLDAGKSREDICKQIPAFYFIRDEHQPVGFSANEMLNILAIYHPDGKKLRDYYEFFVGMED